MGRTAGPYLVVLRVRHARIEDEAWIPFTTAAAASMLFTQIGRRREPYPVIFAFIGRTNQVQRGSRLPEPGLLEGPQMDPEQRVDAAGARSRSSPWPLFKVSPQAGTRSSRSFFIPIRPMSGRP
jgi:hypothetical protein